MSNKKKKEKIQEDLQLQSPQSEEVTASSKQSDQIDDTTAAPAAKAVTIVQPVIPPNESLDETEEDPDTPYLASDMYKRVIALINNFEADMPEDMQAGGRLVSAGNITFSIQDVGFWDPNMIVFYGELSDGSNVELVQHLSQLNLLLVAVKRTDDIDKPRRVIGFNTKNEPDFAEPEPVYDE